MDTLRVWRLRLTFIMVLGTASAAYCWQTQRAVGEPGLCKRVTKHVAGLSDGAEPPGTAVFLSERVADQCDVGFTKKQAKCVLAATSLEAVRRCPP